MKQTVNWGIIGLGNIAFEFAKAFHNADNAELIAIASKSNTKLNKFKNYFKIKNENSYNSYEDISKNQDIDIFYIALPNSLHFEWVQKLIKKKKNILVEKPAFISTKEAEKIFNIKDFNKVFFSEGFMYMHHPQILDVIKMIKEGKIGKLIEMKSQFGINLLYKKKFFGLKKKKIDKNNRLFNKKLGGGVIFDLGCYTSSISLLIASLIKNLDISKFKIEDIKTEYLDNNIDVSSFAKINFDNKFYSHVSSSFAKDISGLTSIIGKDGMITLEDSWKSKRSILKLSGKFAEEKVYSSLKNIYTLEIENISKDILENKIESTFPGPNRKHIFLNNKLINNWIGE